MHSELFMSHMCMVRGECNSRMSFSKGSALCLLKMDQNINPGFNYNMCPSGPSKTAYTSPVCSVTLWERLETIVAIAKSNQRNLDCLCLVFYTVSHIGLKADSSSLLGQN